MTDISVTASEPEDEIEEEFQSAGAPPGTVFVGDESVAWPGDGVAWIGDIVINPDW